MKTCRRFMIRNCLIEAVVAFTLFGVLSVSSSAQTDSGAHFIWRKDNSRGLLESYGVELDGKGDGQFYFTKRNEDEIKLPVTLRASAMNTLR